MNTFHSRRAAASCGALALLLGVGALVPLSAQASTGSGLGGLGGVVGGTVQTVTTGLVPTTSPSVSVAGIGVTVLPTTAPSTGITVPGVVTVDPSTLLGGSGGGGIGVTVGADGSGGSLVSVGIGGSGSGGGSATSTTTTTTGGSSSSTTTGGSSTTTTTGGGTGGTTGGSGTTGATVLDLAVAPSLAAVYPVRDGYRDDVVFRVVAHTASNARVALTGSAVLTRGKKAITRWAVSQSTQDLRWNGLDHGKVVAGAYVLTATVKDASGASHTAQTRITASAKRLIASTQKVSTLSVSGKHTMAAKARAGLGKGVVTLRLTTVAPKVKGKQFLIFQKGTKQLKVRIRQGTRTTKAVRVPKELTSYTLKHTWKKGQVKLKSIRYTYSYQALR